MRKQLDAGFCRTRQLLFRISALAILGLFLAPCVRADATAASGAITFHNDGRGTPKLVVPAQGEAVFGNSRKGAEIFLRQHQVEWKLPADLSSLELQSTRESLTGTHYRYRQVLSGVPVQSAEVIVSISRQGGQVFQAYNNSYPVEVVPPAPKALLGEDRALDVAWEHLRVHGKLLQQTRSTLVYLPEKGGFRLAYKTLVAVEEPFGYWEHKVDAVTGEILQVRDTAVNRKGEPRALPKFAAYEGPVWSRAQTTAEWQALTVATKSTTPVNKSVVDGTARVFDPDPRTYLANASLLDTNLASAFTGAYVTRPLRQISLNLGIYSLDGPWVTLADFEAPTDAPSTTSNGQWMAARGNNAFNDAMVYFHIDQNQRYLQSLGYVGNTGIQYGPISVDSDGLSGDDNSHYLPDSNRLAFGHGGVDDDEDADVILHEYGHAITHDIVPTWGGGDSGAIGEGFGDYWGGSYSSTTVNGKTFHPEWAFSWDGHSADTWPGRFLNMTNLTYDPTHIYVAHETINNIANYSDQLWSAPLWAAFTTLQGMGQTRSNIDKVIIESFYGVGANVTMREMAYATVIAATNLFPAGPYGTVFTDRFLAQNILPPAPVADPTFVVPAGGQTFTTGAVLQVTWNRQGAPAAATAQLEYSSGAVTNFADNMERGVNGWTTSHAAGGTWDWYQTTSASRSPATSWYSLDANGISDQYLRSPSFTVSANAALSFWHNYDLETDYDGGVVELTSNNGSTWTDIGSLATQNGYDSTIWDGSRSPIATRSAFSGSSGGFVQTLIPLNSYAGKTVSIRFRLGTDESLGVSGWWVDDVAVVAQWTPIGTTAAGVSSYAWTAPLIPGTNYVLRLQQSAPGFSPSAWVESGRFALGNIVTRPTIQSVSVQNGTATLTWSAVAGTTYRVQYKTNPDDANWTNLTPDMVAAGPTATKIDQPVVAKRFYRVIVP